MHNPRIDFSAGPADSEATPRRRSFRAVAVAGVLALTLSACGGQIAESVLEEALERESGGDVDIEFDGDGGFSASVDGAEVEFGSGDRPGWLPGWWELPDGLTITWQYQDEGEGEAAVTGWLETDSDPRAVTEAAKRMVEDAGFTVGEEFDGGQTVGFNAVHPDGDGIRFGIVDIGDGMLQYGVEFTDDLADTVVDAVGEGEGSGADQGQEDSVAEGAAQMTLAANGETVVKPGFCSITGTLGQFFSDDGYASLLVESNPPTAAGGVSSDDGSLGYFMNPNDGDFSVSVTESGFGYEGSITNLDGSFTGSGVIEVTC